MFGKYFWNDFDEIKVYRHKSNEISEKHRTANKRKSQRVGQCDARDE